MFTEYMNGRTRVIFVSGKDCESHGMTGVFVFVNEFACVCFLHELLEMK